MNSCLYECQMMHARFAPKPHRFAYRIFLFAIDLDELEQLPSRVAFFSLNRWNAYSFRERDYLPTTESVHPNPPLKETIAPTARLKTRVENHLAERGHDVTGGRVLLVTLPRVAGYLFNPVSFYFCWDRFGQPVAAIAEVTNTFAEMKPYVIPLQATASPPGSFRLRVPKHFYVSPFSDVDVEFEFELQAPDAALQVQIDDFTAGTRTFTSTLRGTRQPLTSARLAWCTLKYPLITLRIISLIHWHALLLWLKRVPWFAKAARAADQRDLFRPHASLRRGAETANTTGAASVPTTALSASTAFPVHHA